MIFHHMTDPYYLHLHELYKHSRSHKKLLHQYQMSNTHSHEGTDCWEWQGSLDAGGYGRCSKIINGYAENYAHRASYRAFVGPIPDDHEIDHKCRNRRCGNPAHLRTVTHQVNCQYRNEAKDQCSFGHAFTPENTHLTKKGHKVCKACRYRRVKEWRERHPEQAREVFRSDKARWREKQRDNGREGGF